MDKVCVAFAVLLLLVLPAGHADQPEEEAKAMVERSNERCDDFYRYRRELEQDTERREKSAHEMRDFRKNHDAEIEAARKDYVRNRKTLIPDPHLEKQFEEESKGWIEHNKLEGRRYAERKARAKEITRKGCRVPEMKEYDLED